MRNAEDGVLLFLRNSTVLLKTSSTTSKSLHGTRTARRTQRDAMRCGTSTHPTRRARHREGEGRAEEGLVAEGTVVEGKAVVVTAEVTVVAVVREVAAMEWVARVAGRVEAVVAEER